jgi:hypothetical protein
MARFVEAVGLCLPGVAVPVGAAAASLSATVAATSLGRALPCRFVAVRRLAFGAGLLIAGLLRTILLGPILL